MSHDPSNELAQFHQFLGNCLTTGSTLTPEDALELWRTEHPADWEVEQTLRAVQESLADMDAGETGMPLDEFIQQFRQRHGLSNP